MISLFSRVALCLFCVSIRVDVIHMYAAVASACLTWLADVFVSSDVALWLASCVQLSSVA